MTTLRRLKMDSNTIQKILDISNPPLDTVVIDGRTYSLSKLQPVIPPSDEPLRLHTLSGLVSFVNELDNENSKVVISSPEWVELIGKADLVWSIRPVYVHVECFPFNFRFDRYYPQDEFMIKLMTQFATDGQHAEVMKLVGNVSNEHETRLEDDGFTQRVSVKKGARFEFESVINPRLAPFRTFREIEQPLSQFVLREKDGQFALFDTEGEGWKYVAMERIADYLHAEVPELTVLY
jgi:hypothetical protein